MRISHVATEELLNGFLVSAEVRSLGGGGGQLWFEVMGGAATPSAEMATSAVIAASFPSAAWLGENLRCESPCDEEFFCRTGVIAAGLARLHGFARTISVSAPVTSSPPKLGRMVGASFSGGVDSFYTLLNHRDPEGLDSVGALVTALGFDTRLDDDTAHSELVERLGAVAEAEGVRLFTVKTNFRQVFSGLGDWGELTHGGLLMSLAFVLSGSLHTYLVPSSYPIDRLFPWGSHPLIDNAHVSSHTKVVNDAWDVHRNEKLPAIAEWPLAMRHLRVCARDRAVRNCGVCEKCIRTKTLLYLNDKLEAAESFDKTLTPQMLSSVSLKSHAKIDWYLELAEIAGQRPEHRWVVQAIRVAVRRGRVRIVKRAVIGGARRSLRALLSQRTRP